MKRIIALLPCMILLLQANLSWAQFDKYFHNKTLRMDYAHCGDSQHDEIYFEELLEEPYWGGSKTNLIDTMFYGNYYLNVYDVASNQLIYSRGYCTLFWEWQTTDEAKTTQRCCSETVVMPFPKNDVRIEISARNKKGKFVKKFDSTVDVDSYFIKKDRRMQYPTYDVHYTGNPSRRVDIVLLPEGYTADEMDKFKADCKLFAEGLFSLSPYKENQGLFNIRAVLAPSQESGVDIPGEYIWKNTILNSSFYTFDSERYIMTYDNKSLRDLSANVPYDFIYIIANTQKYGGGAIYNHYGISISGNLHAAKVYVHEFGHLFLGLGDEYVEVGSSYNDMYPTNVEPWEANLTTLTNFNKKWKDMLDKDTPVPTTYDPQNPKKLGAYEGGGYVSKGVYRPRYDCLMNTLSGNDFCPVCIRAIKKQIDFYTR